jgi:broad specificity phosphatase PhoE
LTLPPRVAPAGGGARRPPVPVAARRLVVVRHGRTAWNAERRFQGHADVELDGMGAETAQEVAEALAGPDVAAVASSDMRRAVATAAPLARNCGLNVIVDPRLREVDVGRWEGLRPSEVAARFPAEWEAWQAGGDARRGGGETLAEAGRRVATALIDLALTAPAGGRVVAVGHGLSLRAALGQMAADGLVVIDAPPPHLGNGEWLAVPLWPPGQQSRRHRGTPTKG